MGASLLALAKSIYYYFTKGELKEKRQSKSIAGSPPNFPAIGYQTCQKYVKKMSKVLSGVHGSARSTVRAS